MAYQFGTGTQNQTQSYLGVSLSAAQVAMADKAELAKTLLSRDNEKLRMMKERWEHMIEDLKKYIATPLFWVIGFSLLIGSLVGGVYLFYWTPFIIAGFLFIPIGTTVGLGTVMWLIQSSDLSRGEFRKYPWALGYAAMWTCGILGITASVGYAIFFFIQVQIVLGILMVPFALAASIGLVRWAYDKRREF